MKRASPKIEEFLSPNLNEDQKKGPNIFQRSDAHHSQIIGGDADVDQSQIIGEDAVKLFGEYIPPSPPGFGTPGHDLRLDHSIMQKKHHKR